MKSTLIFFIGKFYNALSYISKTYAANKAIKLFTKPRKGKLTEMQNEFLETAFQEELKYNQFPIMTYRWLGKKETILLVHGWESNSARWKNLIINLKEKGYNVIALDAPAHGKSGSKLFNALLYSEFINVVANHFKPSIIVGHSVGGMASVFFQYKYQMQSVQKLILLGAPSEFKDVFKRYTDMMGYNKSLTRHLDVVITNRFGNKPEEFSAAKYIRELNSKGLIIHDEMDNIIPYSDALLLKNNFKNSTLITTNGLGHSLDHETVNNHIYKFIET